MTTFTNIKSQINELAADVELQETHSILMSVFNDLSSANVSYSKEEIETLVLGESDALDSGEVEEDTQLWLDIRDIQNNIIEFFIGYHS